MSERKPSNCVFIAGWQNWAFTFVGGEEDHWCYIQRLENTSFHTQKYIGIPEEGPSGQRTYSKCFMYDYNYDQLSDEEIRNWNRSTRVTNETKTIPCTKWRFEFKQYYSTLQTKVCVNISVKETDTFE